jgi:hypothetical protein
VLDAAADPVGTVLALCDRGRAALAEAQSITEGRDVLGMLSTLEHAVKVRDLNADAVIAASAMRVRAERRVGELIRAERERGTLASTENKPGRPRLKVVDHPDDFSAPPQTLADVGISRDQAAEFTRLADVDEDAFEDAVEAEAERAREQGGTSVTRSGVLRRLNPEREKSPDGRWLDADRFIAACKQLADRAEAAVAAIRFGAFPGDDPLVSNEAQRQLDRAVAALTDVCRAWDRRKR